MYYSPYSQYIYPCEFCMMRYLESAFIRMLHASPAVGAVDIYANGQLIAKNLMYGRFSPYIKIIPGRYNIKVYAAGNKARPIIDTEANFVQNQIYTSAVIGNVPNYELYIIHDTRMPILRDKANIRFVHLSLNAPSVDITLPDGKILFSNISYKGVTSYISVAPSRYTVEARLTGTDIVVLTVPNIVLKPERNYTLYAVGLSEGKPPLQLLIPLDGSTYLGA